MQRNTFLKTILATSAAMLGLSAPLAHAADPDDALAKVFALAGPPDVRGVWVGGDRLR